MIEAADIKKQIDAPRPVLQLVVTLLSNGGVVVGGPLDNKANCIGTLAAGIHAVLEHKESNIIVPNGPLPEPPRMRE